MEYCSGGSVADLVSCTSQELKASAEKADESWGVLGRVHCDLL